jgi:transcriptional repressor NrdR
VPPTRGPWPRARLTSCARGTRFGGSPNVWRVDPTRARWSGSSKPRLAETSYTRDSSSSFHELMHSGTTVAGMRCPWCQSLDDKVVDSRLGEDGGAIRRRRECLACGRRFTTYERVEGAPLWVVKRSGQREPFDRSKVVAGARSASKNRPVSEAQLENLAQRVEEALREAGSEVTSQQVGVAVLEHLRQTDEVSYLRFASVYKGFEDLGDFQREVGLLTKSTEPKRKG